MEVFLNYYLIITYLNWNKLTDQRIAQYLRFIIFNQQEHQTKHFL